MRAAGVIGPDRVTDSPPPDGTRQAPPPALTGRPVSTRKVPLPSGTRSCRLSDMDLLPPLVSELQSAFQDAEAEGLMTPVSGLLVGPEESSAEDHAPDHGGCWDCTDSTEWSPGLWWLLNWWTSMHPAGPGSIHDVDFTGGSLHPVDSASAHGPTEHVTRLAPALADLGDDHAGHGPPPPPIPRDVVQQLVSRGEGIVDLLA